MRKSLRLPPSKSLSTLIVSLLMGCGCGIPVSFDKPTFILCNQQHIRLYDTSLINADQYQKIDSLDSLKGGLLNQYQGN